MAGSFPFDDFEAMETVLDELIVVPDLRKQMGESARVHVMANHTWEGVARHIMSVANGKVMELRESREPGDRERARLQPSAPMEPGDRVGVDVPLR